MRDAEIGWDVYIDPGCDGGPSTGENRQYECDPVLGEGCAPGMACYAWPIAPSEPCEEEVFISVCMTPGPGRQGEECLDHSECNIGHICVVTGAGTQCVATCNPSGAEPRCPRGYLCRSTDVPGLGACF